MIENNMVTKSIENAQKRVEENNFGIRKRLVEYDDVMNAQRNGVCTASVRTRSGENVSEWISPIWSMRSLPIWPDADLPTMNSRWRSILSSPWNFPFTEAEFGKLDNSEIVDRMYEAVMETLARKKRKWLNPPLPILRNFRRNAVPADR